MGNFQQRYNNAAVGCLNTFVLFVVLNVVIGYSFTLRHKIAQAAAVVKTNPIGRPRTSPLRTPWQLQFVDATGYEGIPEKDVDGMLDEVTTLGQHGFIYQPWVESSPPLFTGKYFNMLDGGGYEFPYRKSVLDDSIKPDPSWPQVDVYTFGGSTMWGDDVADGWTVASYLWDELQKKAMAQHVRIQMYNYGRPLYFSTQEVLLFDRLLRADHHPKIAIFLDGLNDTILNMHMMDQPGWTGKIASLVAAEQVGRKGTGLRDYQWIPMVRLAYTMRHMFDKPEESKNLAAAPLQAGPGVDERAAFVLSRYAHNVDLARYLGTRYGCKTCFYWQPVPVVGFNPAWIRQLPLFTDQENQVYARCYEMQRRHPTPGVVNLSAVYAAYGADKHRAYIDDVHYSPPFAHFLATRMAQDIQIPQP
ncbi:MAG: hypothetical protein ACYCW6_21365 [Candidatus Xenobia bacterium]